MSNEKDSPATSAQQQEKTPLERMRELVRRIVSVPKSEIPKPDPGKKAPKKPD